jgi:hypothetical protein
MEPDQAMQWLVDLCEVQPIENVTIHGGEPFLYFDVMAAILRKARELEIQHRWVITNGFWAENDDAAREKLRLAKETGLTAITFSVDAFHQEYVPFDLVRSGIKCAAKLNFDTVAVDSYFLFGEHHKHRYNIETREYLRDLEMMQKVEINKFAASFEGRAATLPGELEYTGEEIPSGRCRTPFWLGGDLKDPKTIEIDCDGTITLCPGISIGNAGMKSLGEILGEYDYKEHPIIRTIVEMGPTGLFELARSKGYNGARRFVNECHLCYEMRRYLRNYFGDYLAPQGCYEP